MKARRNLIYGLLFLAASTACAGVLLEVPYIEQPDDQTCLPTCLTMALHFMGKAELTSETVFKLQPRTNYDRYNLPEIVKEYGLHALPTWHELSWTTETVKQELDAGRPVIIGVNQGRYGHFVLAIGYTDDGKVILNDPSKKSPGYDLGGSKEAYPWELLNWRGGVMLRTEPFPGPQPFSAKMVKAVYPKRLRFRQGSDDQPISQMAVEVKNTGSEKWPTGLTLNPVDPESSPTRLKESKVYYGQAMLQPGNAVKPDREEIAPGETTQFQFRIRPFDAPRATTHREYWNIFSADGQRLSKNYLQGPGNKEIQFTIVVEPESTATLPLIETGTPEKPSSTWYTKHGTLLSDNSTTGVPNGHSVFKIMAPPGKKYETAWVGNSDWTDYRVEAWIYCELRPDVKDVGWERYGIFLRDNGHHAADTKNAHETGESYMMCFDTDDGTLRAGNVENGGIDDFRGKENRYFLKEPGWHKFAVRCSGKTITYELDDKPFHTVEDGRLSSGDCGVHYKNAFGDKLKSNGLRFAGFRVEK